MNRRRTSTAMLSMPRVALVAIASLVLAALTSAAATASETSPVISVTLQSGRTFEAAVDARTDRAQLWLRFDSSAGVLLRPVDWNRVTSAEYQGQRLTANELQGRVSELQSRSAIADDLPTTSAGEPSTVLANRASLPTADGPADKAPTRPAVRWSSTPGKNQAPLDAPLPVATIQADATIAHWGPNVEADGIVLVVTPQDAWGALVPVDGTLSVELIGDRRSRLQPQTADLRERFSQLGQWTFALTAEQFAAGRPVVLRLPFQAYHPQFDSLVDGRGMLTIRLAVPGQAVLATSVSDLRIRPLDNFRSRIENSTGRRFFPQEQTGRSSPGFTQQ
ncbi:MAG: hypothetical protein K8T25_13730 [Planctomycetia bacterium]|nr:hypothetical protein [Planctomycetia bacterium]